MTKHIHISATVIFSLMLALGCGQQNTADLTAIVDQMRQAYNDHDAAAIADLYAEDATYTLAGEPEPLRGRKAIEENYVAFLAEFPDSQLEFPFVVASGDHVFTEGVVRGTHAGPTTTLDGEAPPTGHSIEIPFAFVLKVNAEGLIEEDRTYFDSAVMASQLGLSEASRPEDLSQQNKDVRGAVDATWQQYLGLWEKGDAAACASYFTEDHINILAGGATQHGRAELEAMFTDFLSSSTVDVLSRTTEDVSVQGNLVYEVGRLEQKITPAEGEPTIQRISYVSVFKRQLDGSLKWYRWMGLPNQ